MGKRQMRRWLVMLTLLILMPALISSAAQAMPEEPTRLATENDEIISGETVEKGDDQGPETLAAQHTVTAVDDEASVVRGQSVIINVLDNDSVGNPDHNALKVQAIIEGPTHGTAAIVGNGDIQIQYNSNADSTATSDKLQYRAGVGNSTFNDKAWVTITIEKPGPEPPTTGSLVIKKSIIGGEGSDPAKEFEVALYSTDNSGCEKLGTISVNTPWTITDLPFGSYAIEELVSECDTEYEYVSGAGGITIDSANPDEEVTIINRYTPEPPPPTTGSLVIKKVILGDTGFDATKEFTVTVRSTDEDNSYEVTDTICVDTDLSIAEIPFGSYTIQEQPGTDSEYQYDTNIYIITINSSEPAHLTIINSYQSNQPPTARNLEVETPVNTSITIELLPSCSDPDGDALTLDSITQPTNGTASQQGGTIVYTPTTDFAGEDSFTYTISDGHGHTATATIICYVYVPNHAPVANHVSFVIRKNEKLTINALQYCSDADADTLAIIDITDPEHGSATLEDNIIDYMPATDYTGTDQFTYTVSDDKEMATATITIHIIPDAEPTWLSLRPILDGVTYNGDETWTAHWGWLNENEVAATALICKFTGTIIGDSNFPAAFTFAPGRHYKAFSTIFTSQNLVWTLQGPNGETRTATATRTVIPDPEPEPELGNLTIHKEMIGRGYNPKATFTITVEHYDAPLRNGSTPYTVLLRAGESHTLKDLPAGFYLVRETATPGSRYRLEHISNDGIVQVEAEKTAQVIVTNRYRAPIVIDPDPEDPEPEPEPEQPIEPEEPTVPDEPNQPTEPEEPVTPTEPQEPEQPEEPVVPSDPQEPSDPTEPTTPEEPDLPADEPLPSTSALHICYSLGSLLTLSGLWLRRRKRQ